MDGSSVRRPSLRLRPTLEGLEGKVLLSVVADKGQHATIGRARADGLARPSSVEALPSATLTLKTSRGSVTLAMEALPETSARPALVYRYTVQSGTGAYLGATGSGTAYLG